MEFVGDLRGTFLIMQLCVGSCGLDFTLVHLDRLSCHG